MVNDYLYINLAQDIFAIGDVAFCKGFSTSNGDEKPLPMTNQIAISQGRYVAYTIKRFLQGRRIFKYYPYTPKFIIPLGEYYALADFGWLKLWGFLPWTLKRFAALKYFLSILPMHKAFKLWWTRVRF